MEEKVFFDEGNVRVTNARFIVENQTYAMNGVTSVKSHSIAPNRTLAIVLIVVGVLMIASSGDGGKILGLAIAALGGWIIYSQKSTYAVVLNSSSGEAQALTSQDEPYIASVVSALNDALIYRG